jgi:hypothetical protein
VSVHTLPDASVIEPPHEGVRTVWLGPPPHDVLTPLGTGLVLDGPFQLVPSHEYQFPEPAS